MKLLHQLESGDTVFIITDKYKIKKIKLAYEHLVKNKKERRLIDHPYQLSSSVALSGKVRLTKVSYFEEMDWNIGGHYIKRWREYEDTDKFAYISREDAESALESQISSKERTQLLTNSVKKDLDHEMSKIKSILNQYFKDINSSGLEDIAKISEYHNKLLNLHESIRILENK